MRDVGLVGRQDCALGELDNTFYAPRDPRAERFAISASAYRDFLGSSGLDTRVTALLNGLDTSNSLTTGTWWREESCGVP